ncbi:MAG: DnaJ domain-containing protein [Ignavibacteriota bacterium]
MKRRNYRVPVSYPVVFYWEDAAGVVYTTRPRARDISTSGMRVDSDMAIPAGTQVCLEVPQHESAIEAVVRYCQPDGSAFRIGLEFEKAQPHLAHAAGSSLDYYEVLQLSPVAETETIHRVYRIMAARFHPDNPESGDSERFLLLTEAYRVLSDPAQRAQYDRLKSEPSRALPLFQARAFVDEKEGEHNRRLGVLCLLYTQRRRNPDRPTVGLIELEEMMSIPREYLEFTLWYLKQKKYLEMGQGADYSLTAGGVDFVEEHTGARDLLMRLLGTGGSSSADDAYWANSDAPLYSSVQ